MRICGHCRFTRVLRLLYECIGQAGNKSGDLVNLFAHIKAQVGGDLLVAAAARVQLASNLPSERDYPSLDVMVNVLDGWIVIGRYSFTSDLIECRQTQAQFLRAEHIGLGQRGRVRLAGGNFVWQQDAVKRERPLPVLKLRIGGLVEAP